MGGLESKDLASTGGRRLTDECVGKEKLCGSLVEVFG